MLNYICPIILDKKEFAMNEAQLSFLTRIKEMTDTKKIITPKIKQDLIDLGFKEVVVGCYEIHKITSKEIKTNYHGHDIAIGLSPRAISYASNRQYRAMTFSFKK